MTTSSLKQRVFVCREPTDLRLHFEGLWGLVRSSLGKDPLDGDHFVFIARSRKRVKVLRWDGTGLCILCKRLAKGLFFAPWQHKGTGPVVLTPSELALLLEGCEQVGRMRLSPEPWLPSVPEAAELFRWLHYCIAFFRRTRDPHVSVRRRHRVCCPQTQGDCAVG